MTSESSDLKPIIRPVNVNVWKNVVYGGTAGFVGSLSTFPIDTAKTRLQEQVRGAGGTKQYTGIFDCLVKMVKAEGLR